MKRKRERLDERVVREGLAPTRAQAQALILAGRVLVDDVPAEKAGQGVAPEARVRLRGELRRFVSRGGEKLAGALADLGVDPAGKVCLDLGASTGGFVDCLLQHGAAHVVAVDVGYGQLDLRLRDDPRVRLLERTNARYLDPADVPEAIGLATLDVSFISATLLLPRLAEIAPAAELLVLVKPQFEVGRRQVGRGGLVTDPALHLDALSAVATAAQETGYGVRGACPSPITGAEGNREFFLRLVVGAPALDAGAFDAMMRAAVHP
jgi:23S rRNA (cytidine1920-2'-O)/16S rRNA (cytidine1409-2'-O)-methyltransferase